jgi:hypothetical protein
MNVVIGAAILRLPVVFSDRPRPGRKEGSISIGSLVYPHLDQIDFTGPLEVFSRIPDAKVHIVAKTGKMPGPRNRSVADMVHRLARLFQHCTRDYRRRFSVARSANPAPARPVSAGRNAKSSNDPKPNT